MRKESSDCFDAQDLETVLAMAVFVEKYDIKRLGLTRHILYKGADVALCGVKPENGKRWLKDMRVHTCRHCKQRAAANVDTLLGKGKHRQDIPSPSLSPRLRA